MFGVEFAPKPEVTVCVSTYGDESWVGSAESIAIPSVYRQTFPVEVIHSHHKYSLSESRNQAALSAETEWIIFLDADDELDPSYVEEMLQGTADLRRPSTLGVVDGVEDDFPYLIPEKDILTSNYIVIGTMVRRQQFLDVGGFSDLPILEDWDLWIRMLHSGCSIEAIPKAIYRVHVNSNSRNSDHALADQYAAMIRSKYRRSV